MNRKVINYSKINEEARKLFVVEKCSASIVNLYSDMICLIVSEPKIELL